MSIIQELLRETVRSYLANFVPFFWTVLYIWYYIDVPVTTLYPSVYFTMLFHIAVHCILLLQLCVLYCSYIVINKKMSIFLNSFMKHWSILIIFGRQHQEET